VTVRAKLLVILGIVAAVPLAVFATTTRRTYEAELASRLEELHGRTAEAAARTATTTIDAAQRAVGGLARTIPWGALSGEELAGALRLITEQLDHLADAKIERVAATDHAVVGWSVAEPTRGSGAPAVRMALVVAGAGSERWRLQVGLSLAGICEELAATAPTHVTTTLLDARGRPLCGALATGDVLTASRSAGLGWTATVQQPRAAAFGVLDRLRLHMLAWIAIGIAIAMVAGIVLTRAIRRPLHHLGVAADAIARGELEHRVPVTSPDELGALGVAFNRMASELQLAAAQDQLVQSRKLAAVAALGAGVAHEINNPLTGVLGMTQIMLATAGDPRLTTRLQTIEREALRIRGIVERMATLAQETLPTAQRVDLASVVEAVTTARGPALAAAGITVNRAGATIPPLIMGNPAQLELAIGQLVDNSIKAMQPGGLLTLAVRRASDAEVSVSVADTGRGIAPDLHERIFEPFFTTKDDWSGVGLGLALVDRIVDAHHGHIHVTSEVGAGTTMTVTLPVAAPGAHLE